MLTRRFANGRIASHHTLAMKSATGTVTHNDAATSRQGAVPGERVNLHFDARGQRARGGEHDVVAVAIANGLLQAADRTRDGAARSTSTTTLPSLRGSAPRAARGKRRSSSLARASMIAFAEASRLSPSTIRVNSPNRSVMWCGCHGVVSRRSETMGTASSARKRHTSSNELSAPGGHKQPRDPQQLQCRDRGRVDQGGAPKRARVPRRAEPLHHERNAHHHVAGHDQREVLVVECRPNPCREREHARHLDDGEHAVEPVVGVERGGEPREVHPRPPNGEEHRPGSS